jgi:hypothetical protein
MGEVIHSFAALFRQPKYAAKEFWHDETSIAIGSILILNLSPIVIRDPVQAYEE